MALSETVTFGAAEGGIDRATHLREQSDRLLRNPRAALLPLWQGKPLIDLTGAPALGWAPPDPEILARAAEEPVFLGMSESTPCFTADFSAMPEDDADDLFCAGDDGEPGGDGAKFIDLRSIAPDLSPAGAATAATAKGVLEWHRTHRFCATCGAPSEIADGGWRRTCTDRSCNRFHFPRTDPVVIMLVLRDDEVLVGRQSAWPEGVYSLLAGFMEPGETIEDAVRRETFEEAGIRVGEVGYLASQPWPFPASLMIGCQGKALDREIVMDPLELEDAQWISRAKMQVILAGKHPKFRPPRAGAIAGAILRDWAAGRIETL